MARTTAQARELFRAAYNGNPNLMTPTVERHGWHGNFAWELSRGEFMGSPLYGVTVLEVKGGPEPERRADLNRCYRDGLSAHAYIQSGFTLKEDA